jgi:hypothetical protein
MSGVPFARSSSTHSESCPTATTIQRLRAKWDGVLRQHTVFENDKVCATVVYSVADDERPTATLARHDRITGGHRCHA